MRPAIAWTQAALATAALAVAASASPAAAQGPGGTSCDPVVRALQALGAAPRYHWWMTATTPARRRPVEREQIVLDDDVYMTPDNGRWMKQRIAPAERIARVADELARNPVSDCRLVGTDSVDGIPMTLYSYRQGTAPFAEGDGDALAKRIWIGVDDGLPHFFKATEGAVSVTMRVRYDQVENPLP